MLGAGTASEALSRKPLNILVLGGTGFIGPHQVEYAVSRGHKVTLFNRGKTNAELFPKLEKVFGDRTKPNAYDSLKGRKWDIVIDNGAQVPAWVREAGAALKDSRSEEHTSELQSHVNLVCRLLLEKKKKKKKH